MVQRIHLVTILVMIVMTLGACAAYRDFYLNPA